MPIRVQPLFTLTQRENFFPIFAVGPRSAHLLNPDLSNREEKLNQFANIGIRKIASVVAFVESVDTKFFEIDGID